MAWIAALSVADSARAQAIEATTLQRADGRRITRTIPPQKFYALEPRSVPLAAEPADDEPSSTPAPTSDPSAPYVTYCVRACDGFYFPLRQNALRDDFSDDAARCASSCNGQAKLFYAPLFGGGPQSMIDLEGRKYADAPNAFAYRKSLLPGCNCKPPPWSLQAAARHRDYAQAATIEEARRKAARLLEEREQVLASVASTVPSATAEKVSTADSTVAERAYSRAVKFKIRPAPRRHVAASAWRAITR